MAACFTRAQYKARQFQEQVYLRSGPFPSGSGFLWSGFQGEDGWPVFRGCAQLLFMFSGEDRAEQISSLILIAEDDDNDVKLIRRAFRRAQFEHPLQVVPNGEEAIAYLKGESPFEDRDKHPTPALVLLDLKMPGKNGFEVLTWIRDRAEFNALPVVVLTSSQESSDINRAYALGANSYLVKPANFLSLVDMINRLKEYFRFTSQNVGSGWV